MWRKLLSINISNVLAATSGFLANYFLVNLIGLEGFGEFSVTLARLNLLFLLFIFLPQSYAIFRLQDDKSFKDVYFSFNVYINIIVAALVLLFNFHTDLWWVLIFYTFSNGLQTYADSVFQSAGKTGIFFKLVMFSAVIRCLCLGIFYLFGIQLTMIHVWLFLALGQLIFAFVFFFDRALHEGRLIGIIAVAKYIITNLNTMKQYYLYAGLKRVQDSSPLILFDLFISKEAIGLFSLLLKPLIFFVSLIRTVESFLTSRAHFAAFHRTIKNRVLIISSVLFAIFIPFSALYMYVYTGKFELLSCLILAILVPLFVAGTLSRVEQLASYNQSRLNQSCIIFILVNILLSGAFYLMNITGIYSILTAFVICHVLSISYLVSFDPSE